MSDLQEDIRGDDTQSNERTTKNNTVCILGVTYYLNKREAETSTGQAKVEEPGALFVKMNSFLSNVIETTSNIVQTNLNMNYLSDTHICEDIRTRILFTYRTDFEPIAKITGDEKDHGLSVLLRAGVFAYYSNVVLNNDTNSFITDIGWGCMIRTSQSLLANALQLIHRGRNYRHTSASTNKDEFYIEWFKDEFEYPFSIQNFVKSGYELSDKKPGEWFSPSAAARSIQQLVHSFPESDIDDCYISIDSGTIYLEDVNKMFSAAATKKTTQQDCNILILLCVRLGVSTLNEYYWDDLKELLNLEGNTCGISGGKPSSSFYFFGYEDENLLYLDPHSPKSYSSDPTTFIKSTHTMDYKKLHLSNVDPSMMLGFLVHSNEDWIQFQEKICKMNEGKGSRIVQFVNQSDENKKKKSYDEHHEQHQDTHENSQLNSPAEGSLLKVVPSTENDYFSQMDDTEDYVDVGKMMQQSHSEDHDVFQDVQCKQQKILTLGNNSDEVEGEEKVLFVQDTVSLKEDDIT